MNETQNEAVEAERKPLHPEEKVRNYPLYAYRVFAKLISIAVFGIDSLLFSLLALPVCKIIYRPLKNFRYKTRKVVSNVFKSFVKFMEILGIVEVKCDREDYLRNLKSAIVVANHPAYLDPPIMISMLNHTSIMAKAALSKGNLLHKVINDLYLSNAMPFDEIIKTAKEDLDNGNTIMIFPEGTRSSKYGQQKYKKGSARISLGTGCPIVPVYIGGTEKLGLGKGDKVFQFNHTKKYVFDIHVKDPVYPEEFKDLLPAVAAKKMTEKLEQILSDEANAEFRY